MEKIFLRRTLPLLAVGILASCASQSPDQPDKPVNGKADPLTFTTNLKGLTRATETEFESGDAISIFAVKQTEGNTDIILNPSGNHFQNLEFIYDGSQFLSTPEVYKADSENLAYFAVYPYSESNSSIFSFSVNTDQSSRDSYTRSDLCTSSTGYIADSRPNLTFFHRLSNLVVTLEGNHLGGDLTVEYLNAATTADVDLNALSINSTEDRATIIPNEYGTNTWRAIVAPRTYTAGEPIVRATLNGKIYDLAAPSNIELASGKQVNIQLRIVNEVPVIVSGDIYPWNTGGEINYVIPVEILEKLNDHITINYGINPPNIEGCYLLDPLECVYCEDYGNGGYEPGYIVNSMYVLFHDQNMTARTVNYSEVTVNQSSYSIGNGAFISGSGNKFSVFFSIEGESGGIYVKEALVISGEKTAEGVKDLEYAFVMVDKGDDSEHLLMDKGIFRVFRDGNGVALNATWPDFNIPSRPAPLSLNILNSELLRYRK